MPVYAYRCGNCGVEFERVQRFSEDPIAVCPECDKASVRRIIQPAGIIFKGSGWYVKDSKASNPAGKPTKGNNDDSSSSPDDKSASSGDKSGSPGDKSASSGDKSSSSSEGGSNPSEH